MESLVMPAQPTGSMEAPISRSNDAEYGTRGPSSVTPMVRLSPKARRRMSTRRSHKLRPTNRIAGALHWRAWTVATAKSPFTIDRDRALVLTHS